MITTVDKAKAKDYFEKIENRAIPKFKVNMRVSELLRKFIMSGRFDIDNPED